MIRVYLILFLAFALGVGAMLLFSHDSGYVLIHYGHYILECSVPGLLLAVGSAAAVAVLGLRLIGATVRLPQTIRENLVHRKAERARRSFEAGLLRLFEGDWQQAEIDLVRRAADHDTSHLNYLAAAYAAQRSGASERREEYLQQAAKDGESARLASQLMRAGLLLRSGDAAAARLAASKLHKNHPRHVEAISILADSLAAVADWDSLQQLLAESESLGAPSPARRVALMRQARSALIASAVRDARLDRLKTLWDSAGALKADAGLRREYIRGLARLNADSEAAAQIVAVLEREWDSEMVLLFGDLHATDPIAQLAAVESWLVQYGEHPPLLLVAGAACVNARLWGKAQSYLEAALRAAPTPRVCFELARLSEQTQKPEQAAHFFREGLGLAVATRN